MAITVMKIACQFRFFTCLCLLLFSWFLWVKPPIEAYNASLYGIVSALLVILVAYWSIRLQRFMQKSEKLELVLQQNEARLHAIISACPVPLTLNDEAQNITFINPEFTKCFGYTLDEISTLSDWLAKAYPNPNYRQSVIDEWAAAIEKAKQEHCAFEPIELVICCKNGTTRTVMVSATPLDDSFVKPT